MSIKINILPEKASPVSADSILIEDSEASNAKKRVQIGNLPTGSSGSPGADIGARVYNSADQTLSNDVVETVTFNSERWDTDNIHDTATNNSRLTCNTAGEYLIKSLIRFDSNSTGQRQIRLRLNGSTLIAVTDQNALTTAQTNLECSTIYNLSAGDYVECLVYQNSGGDLDIKAVGNFANEFMMQLLSASGGAASASDIGARVYNSTSITISNTTSTSLTFDTEIYDTDNLWTSGSGSQLVCQTAGKYLIIGNVAWEGSASGAIRQAVIKMNGSDEIANSRITYTSTTANMQVVSTTYELNVGDYVELVVYQDSGGDLDIQALGKYSPHFMMHKISSGGGDADAIHDNVAGEISALTEKTVPVGADLVLIEDSEASNAKKKVQISKFADVGVVNGRLTLESGVPVSTSDQSAKTTLYFAPYMGNNVGLFTSGSVGYVRDFSELSLSLTGLTASTPYDIWIYDNAGTLTLDKTAWTDDTTRATAIELYKGIYVKDGDITRRYLGTIYINSTGGQTEDTLEKRFVWNYYNRVARTLYNATYSSHGYTTAAERPWNNDTTERIQYIIGLELEEPTMHIRLDNQINTTTYRASGIAVDNTTSSRSELEVEYSQSRSNTTNQYHAHGPVRHTVAGLGFHYLQAMEYGSGTITFNAYYMDGQLWC